MLSLKLSFVSAKDRVNWNIFTLALLIVCQLTQCIVLIVQCFYLRRNKGLSVLLSAKDKRVAISFHENQRLNLGIQYHKDATKVAPKNHLLFPMLFLAKLMKL